MGWLLTDRSVCLRLDWAWDEEFADVVRRDDDCIESVLGYYPMTTKENTANDYSSVKWPPRQSIWWTLSHSPFTPSRQRVTLLSPQLTANIPPLRLQFTLQTVSANGSGVIISFCHGCPGLFCDQMMTRLSWVLTQRLKGPTWDPEARYVLGMPIEGAKATSRTQSVCPCNVVSSAQMFFSWLDISSWKERDYTQNSRF